MSFRFSVIHILIYYNGGYPPIVIVSMHAIACFLLFGLLTIIPGKQVPQMGSVTHVTPYSKSTYKLLVSKWELSIKDPNLAHVSETVDDLHHIQPGGIHPPNGHRIQPTPFPSRNATLGTVGQKFTAQGHHPATLGFLPFFYYAASHTTTTHNHHI